MVRLAAVLCIAALEALIVGMPLQALTPIGLPWLLLWGVVVSGWAVDALAARLPERWTRVCLGAGAIGALLGMLSTRLPLTALLPGADQWPLAYLLAMLALFLFWRGTRLYTLDSGVVGSLVSRGALIFLLSLLLRPLFYPAGATEVLAWYVLGFICVALFALALARAVEGQAAGTLRLGWRWMATLSGAIGGVVVLSVLLNALLGGADALELARNIMRAIILPFALIGGVIAYILAVTIGEPLARLIRALLANLQLLPDLPPEADEAGEALSELPAFEAIERLAEAATFALALIPLLLLLIAILLFRHRKRPPPAGDEERESLGVAGNLARDLRDLLGRLRTPFGRRLTGLRAALAALHGDDPTTRVRRAYVRLLIALERQEQPRPPATTPAEFAAMVGAVADTSRSVAELTSAYEQARYNPTGATSGDAAAAEAALRVFAERDAKTKDEGLR
jgi:hypothetical protein